MMMISGILFDPVTSIVQSSLTFFISLGEVMFKMLEWLFAWKFLLCSTSGDTWPAAGLLDVFTLVVGDSHHLAGKPFLPSIWWTDWKAVLTLCFWWFLSIEGALGEEGSAFFCLSAPWIEYIFWTLFNTKLQMACVLLYILLVAFWFACNWRFIWKLGCYDGYLKHKTPRSHKSPLNVFKASNLRSN